MQPTKDTFYMTLRNRLAEVDPDLTIEVNGALRPAIIVAENEEPSMSPRREEAFYLDWGGVRLLHPGTSVLMAMECSISYTSCGKSDNGGVDRGRRLGALDTDLLLICAPGRTSKADYSTGEAVNLGSNIFWSVPTLEPLKAGAKQVGRQAKMTVFFTPEVNEQ